MGTIVSHRARRGTSEDSVVTNGVLGMLIFLTTEMMFFGGLISALIVNRSENAKSWPPDWWEARLPIAQTGFNTFLLLLSAVTMFLAVRQIKKLVDANKGKSIDLTANNKPFILLTSTFVLGLAFVSLQGVEWVRLLSYNLTLTSGLYGSFFYTVIGTHALHVLGGLVYLLAVIVRVLKSKDADYMKKSIMTGSIYWYFVVGLWPILYVLVYLF